MRYPTTTPRRSTPTWSRRPSVEETLHHAALHRERRVKGPLGVILECRRSPEHRHDGVADELLDRPTGELDLLTHGRVEALELHPNALGVFTIGECGRADEIGEENGDELALFAGAHEQECRRERAWALAENGAERLFPGA